MASNKNEASPSLKGGSESQAARGRGEGAPGDATNIPHAPHATSGRCSHPDCPDGIYDTKIPCDVCGIGKPHATSNRAWKAGDTAEIGVRAIRGRAARSASARGQPPEAIVTGRATPYRACEHPRPQYKAVATRGHGVQRTTRCPDCGAAAVTWGANWPKLTIQEDDRE